MTCTMQTHTSKYCCGPLLLLQWPAHPNSTFYQWLLLLHCAASCHSLQDLVADDTAIHHGRSSWATNVTTSLDGSSCMPESCKQHPHCGLKPLTHSSSSRSISTACALVTIRAHAATCCKNYACAATAAVPMDNHHHLPMTTRHELPLVVARPHHT
jgi:hypothetical protein